MYKNDIGVKQDNSKATEFYQKVCNGGNAWGCIDFGVMHEYGKGIKQNKTKAKEYYGKACDIKTMKATKIMQDLIRQGIKPLPNNT